MATCPKCEADWSQSSRVRLRRKSHSHGSLRGLLRSSGMGALAFAAASGFLYFAGGRAAQGMGVEAPANVLVRMRYLWEAIAFNARLLGGRFFGFIISGHVLQILGLLVIGAILGAAWYLLQHAHWLRIRTGHQKCKRRRAV
jgi:hypothetical protein